MTTPAIKITGLSKQYNTAPGNAAVITAVNKVSIEIERGSTTGIAGKNGCGKSTLLKMIAGIIKPTEGTIEVWGNLMVFTDFGSGFNPDLTGRENVKMVAGLYGVNRERINALMPAIIEFSELEGFMDVAVKNYSQGMFLRLAFTLMVHLPVEVVLLDEALSVGDEAFRQKCYTRLGDLSKKGLTILLVSHSFEEISMLCDRCIVLEKGSIIADGKPHEIYNRYISSLNIAGPVSLSETASVEEQFEYLVTDIAKLHAIKIINTGNIHDEVFFNSPIEIELLWEKMRTEGTVLFDIIIADKTNNPILTTASYFGQNHTDLMYANTGKSGFFTTKCTLPGMFLNFGVYKISILGTHFKTIDNNVTILKPRHPLALVIKNNAEVNDKHYWSHSNAAVRLQTDWKEEVAKQ